MAFGERRNGRAGLVLEAMLCGTVLLAMSIPVPVQLHSLEYMDVPGARAAFLHRRDSPLPLFWRRPIRESMRFRRSLRFIIFC
jgi:hypothetical protein